MKAPTFAIRHKKLDLWVICGVLAGIAVTGCSDSPSNDEFCGDTGDDEVEQGETSCLFLPECAEAEDEGPTDKLDLEPYSSPSSPPSGSSPPTGTPPSWTYDNSTETYYRLASDFELEEHDWPEGTTIFTAPNAVDALINGTNSTVTLGIPVATFDVTGGPYLSLETLSVQRRRTMNDVTYVTSRDLVVGPVVETFRPDFHLFLPTWVELEDLDEGVPMGLTTFAVVFGDSHGGVAIEGVRGDQTFSVLGPSDSIWLESPPPSTGPTPGVLVLQPRYEEIELDDVLGHWLELADEGCGGTCTWETNEGLPPANCGDHYDNDADCDVDGADWFCKHRPDYGCGNFDDHNHRWENSKDFALLPDIQWCTQMDIDGMPWYSDLYSKGTTAAQMLNAIKLAAAADSRTVPAGLPTINYRFGYCVFANSIEDAIDCSDDAQDCPTDYMVGGFGDVLDDDDSTQRTSYFAALWDELDVAMHKAEDDGITAKPVAMVSAIFSGDIRDNSESTTDQQAKPVGLAAKIGALDLQYVPHILGASTVEANWFVFRQVAHENGHSLGLSHTDYVDSGIYTGLKGFMYPDTSGGLYAILGDNLHGDGYEYESQWSGWALLFPDKNIPRPNAFDHTGCSQHSQCPDPEYCWNAGADGVCWPEAP